MSQPPVKHVPPTTKLPFRSTSGASSPAGTGCFTMRGRSRRTRHAPRRGIAASIWSTVPGTAAHAIRRATRWVRRRAVWRTCRVVRQRVGSRRRSSRRRLRRCRGPKARCSITCVRASPRSMASRRADGARRRAASLPRPTSRRSRTISRRCRRPSTQRRRRRGARQARGAEAVATLGLENGRRAFDAACAVCHAESGGVGHFGVRPLMLNTSVSQAAPDNLLRVLHHGIDQPATGELGYMPGFGDAFDDRQMAGSPRISARATRRGSRRGGTRGGVSTNPPGSCTLIGRQATGNGQRAAGGGNRATGQNYPLTRSGPERGGNIAPFSSSFNHSKQCVH